MIGFFYSLSIEFFFLGLECDEGREEALFNSLYGSEGIGIAFRRLSRCEVG